MRSAEHTPLAIHRLAIHPLGFVDVSQPIKGCREIMKAAKCAGGVVAQLLSQGLQ